MFAVANRHVVTLSFDPFNSSDPGLGVTLPLFVVIIAVAIFGVIAGGISPGLASAAGGGAAKQYEAEARHARAELSDLRERSLAASRPAENRVPCPAPARS